MTFGSSNTRSHLSIFMRLLSQTFTFTWISATRHLFRVIENGGYTTPEQVAEVIRGLEQHQVRYILWRPDYLGILPESENPSDDYLRPLQSYIHSHYSLVKVFSNSAEIWEKKE